MALSASSCLCPDPWGGLSLPSQPSLENSQPEGFSSSIPSVNLTSSPLQSSSLQATVLSAPKCISGLLSEFPDALSSDGFTASPSRHQIYHHLLTPPGPPVFTKFCRLDPVKLAVAKAEFSFSTCSMMYLILVSVPLGDWSLPSLFGLYFHLWEKSCLQCQWSKIFTLIHSSVPAIPVPSWRFSHVHIDIVGPLLSSQGFSYILTMIDQTTWWP